MSSSKTLFDDPSVGLCLADLRGRVRYASPRLAELLDLPSGEPADVASVVAAVAGDRVVDVASLVADVVSGTREQVSLRCERTSVDSAVVSLLRDDDGAPFLVLVELRAGKDIPAPRRPIDSAGTEAVDPLTGLPGRSMLAERLSAVLARATRTPSTVAVMFIDLDDLKDVNANLGHHVGDEVLTKTARRLLNAVRPFDTVTRLGGDEFVVICSDLASQADATNVANRVLDALARPISVGAEEVVVTSSIGIAVAGEGATVEAMLHDADSAMHRAKAHGKNQIEMFDEELRTAVSERAAVELLLHKAIRDELFEAHYQPIYELSSGRLVAVESLLRLRDPERGLLSPANFIDVAELSGLIVPIGAWVLEESCRQLAVWRAAGVVNNDVRVAVNLSARQVYRSDLVKTVCRALDGAAIEPAALSLELTESIFMDADSAHVRQLEELREMGITIEIDDFGTGYSSLGYLKRLPVSVVKVDQSFVAGMLSNSADYGIVSSVIGLGQALGIITIAEGVETAEQLDALWVLGCDQAQGYHLGRPAPPSQPPLALTDWGEPSADDAEPCAS